MTQRKQTILLNRSAVLLESCDSLFVIAQLKDQNIIPHFPFLESVFDALLKQLPIDKSVTFSGVETKHPFLPGYYDYIFSMVDNKELEVIQWQIMDATDSYNEVKIQQQSDHEHNAFPNQSE